MEQGLHEQRLRVLVVEDEEAHAELICRAFEGHADRRYLVMWANSLAQARGLLEATAPDLVIADLLLPDGKGTELVGDPQSCEGRPLIVMTSHGNEEAAVAALKAGALDYIVKSGAAFLDMPRTADRVLREWRHITDRKRAEEALRRSKAELEIQNEELTKAKSALEYSRDSYSELFDFAPVGYLTVNRKGVILQANRTAATLLGMDKTGLVNTPFSNFLNKDDADTYYRHHMGVLETLEKHACELELVTHDGERFYGRLESTPVLDSSGNFSHLRTILVNVTDRHRAERELKEREEELCAIYENAPLILMLIDSDHRVRKTNVAATTFAGRSPSEMEGMKGGEALRCVHSLDDPKGCGFGPVCEKCRVRRTVIDTLETGTSHHQVEASLSLSREGTRKDLFFLLSTTRLNVRQQPMVLVSILDITARKQAQEAERESERRFQAIFENDHVIALIIDPETGRIEDGSPGACAFYGYAREELRKKRIMDINLLPENQVFERIRLATTGQTKYFVFRHRLASGEVRDVEVCTGPVMIEEKTKLFSVISDVTDRKRVEKALRESEERFRAVFESAEECIFLKDRSLRFTHVNSAMCELLGLPSSGIVGKRAEDLYRAETAQQLTEMETRVLSGESIEIEQTRALRGTSLTFHDAMVPLRNERDEIIGICCISRDITERKKLAWEPRMGDQHYPSAAMRSTLKKALIAARTDSIVLLQGESGSGKDYLARWLHDRSKRANGPFFPINCSALPRELAESELFGHERGAFTGAGGLKRGLLELAEGGTILLNEIGELDVPLQAKLLTFLDTHSFLRVGGQKQVQANARLISATHRDLETEVAEGRFLEPLFYRLSVFPLRVPALRERPEDIPVLVEEIIAWLAVEMQLTELPRIDASHIAALSQYRWPGNVRELRNVLERSLMLWQGGEFDLAMPVTETNPDDWSHTIRYVPGKTVRDVTDEIKTFLCAAALDACGGNKTEAARLIDISRDAFYRYIKRMRMKPKKKTT
ncbi:MAG: PAS domain S-box protein [Thermodesulfobacteriota bacterium]